MAHPVAEFRAQVAALQDQLAALTARLDTLAPPPAPMDPEVPVGHHRGPDNLLRDGAGNVVAPAETDAEYLARKKGEWAANDAATAEVLARRTANAPPGAWFDDCGILREVGTGRLLTVADREALERAAVGAVQRQEHREHLQKIGMPVQPARVSLPVRRADPANDLPD
jgi:hypothetical protein